MQTQLAKVPVAIAHSLELVELEFALDMADISAGFDEAAKAAADATGGSLLFTMPTVAIPGCSRVAAICLCERSDRELVLVILGEDGKTTRVETVAESANPLAGLATSWARVMERMPAIAA